MQPSIQKRKDIFEQAIRIESSEDRNVFLEDAFRGYPEEISGFKKLVEDHFRAGSFLESGPEVTAIAEAKLNAEFASETGRYKLLQQIGDGGFGVVYMAEQQKPIKRKVAIKIIKPGMDTKEVIARFEAERQALALMDHPNIAQVLDAGETDGGRPFFAMELVKGAPITEFCDTNKLPCRDRLALFVDVCRAIQHAHQKGVIHRDIKPNNVMVTVNDNKPVPKVIDFGVAKAISQQLTERTMFTAYGQMIGTPVYMSPEQAQLSGLDIDTRSDIYSLGVLLYELLTGTTPLELERLREHGLAEVQRLIVEEDAPTPSIRLSSLEQQRAKIATDRATDPNHLQQFLTGDLDWVIMKSLSKERSRRYETANSLAADIERFLEDKEVEARPPSTKYRIQKFVRRNRASVIAASLVLATLVLGLIGTSIGLVEANRQTRIAKGEQRKKETQRARAVAAEKIADKTAQQQRRELYAANMTLADQLWNSPNGDLEKIEELLAAWIPVDDSEDLREFSWRYQWNRLYKDAAVTALETTGASITPNGDLLSASKHGLHHAKTSASESDTRWSGDASNVTFSPDGRWAAIHLDGETHLIDVATGRSAIDFPHALCSFSARGDFLVAWTAGTHTADIWKLSGDGPSLMEAFVLTGEAKMPGDSASVQLSDDGRSFLFCGFPDEYDVTMFAGDKDEPVRWYHRNYVESSVWSPNGEVMVIGTDMGAVHLRFRRNPGNKIVLSSHTREPSSIRFSQDGTRMVVGGNLGTIDVWDTSALLELSSQPELSSQASDDGDDNMDGQDLLSSARPQLLRTIKAHPSSRIESLVFSADGSKLASFANGVSKLWDIVHTKGRYEVVDFGKDMFGGRTGLWLERSDRGVVVKDIFAQYHDVVSGEVYVGDRIVGISCEHRGDLTHLLKQKGRFLLDLLSGPYQSVVNVTVEDEGNGRRLVELRRAYREDPRPNRVRFSPDGATLVIAGQRHGTTSINLATGQTSRYPQTSSNGIAISADGKLLAMDGTSDLLIWNLRKDQEQARLDSLVSVEPIPKNGHGGSVAFSPDGEFLAMGTGGPHNTDPKRSDLKVWRVSDLAEVGGGPVFKHDRVLSDVTFTPDSAHLIATDHAGIVRVWDTNTFELSDRTFDVGSTSFAVAISPEGKTLAAGGSGQTILWDFGTGKKLRVLKGGTPFALDFSPDGKTLVSGNKYHNVVLWDVSTGMQLQTLYAHSDAVAGVAFSPNGNTLATVGNEGVLRLWEAASFEEIASYPRTHEAMLRLGKLRIQEERYSEAEAVLVRLLELQQKHLSAGHGDIERTRRQIALAVQGQSRQELPPLGADDPPVPDI